MGDILATGEKNLPGLHKTVQLPAGGAPMGGILYSEQSDGEVKWEESF
jgi:hypothetical protein